MSPAAALASCPAFITDSTLANVNCVFDTGSSVTVTTSGSVGSINMGFYSPAPPSFILNNGIVGDSTANNGLLITGSVLSGGITNTGNITTPNGTGIAIESNSMISGGLTNSGTITSFSAAISTDNSTINDGITNTQTGNITSTGNDAFVMDNGSHINGGITNDGTISASGNFTTLVLTNGSTLADGLLNTGTIEATGNGDAVLLRSGATISSGITNSGTISSAGGAGLQILNNALVNGDITNQPGGTISGGNAGISVRDVATINGDILNQAGAIISSSDTGIRIHSGATISGGIQNSGTISGDATGISVLSSLITNGIQNSGIISGGTTGVLISSSATITGGIANHGTIQGGAFAINVDGSSILPNIDLFGGSRVIGALNAQHSDVNIVGDFTSEGTMNVNTFNISMGHVFTMANAITAANGVNNAGTLAISGATLQTIAGDYVQDTGGTLKINAQDTATYGQLAVTGNADLSQSGTINVKVLNGATIVAGNVLNNVISGTTLTAPGGGFTVTDSSRLLNFTAALNGGSNGVNLTAVDDPGTSVYQSNVATGNSGGLGAARKLDDMIALNPSGDWQNIIDALNTLSSDQQLTQAANQTAPALTGATNTALIETMGTASQIVQARQEANAGLSAGEGFQTNRNFWLKPFGSWGDQSNENGVVGYDSKAYGLIGGADKMISDKVRAGVGVSYFNSRLDSNDNNSRVNVDSYLGMVYGSYSLDDRTDVNVQMEAGYNSSDSTRNITFGGLNRIAKGNYGGWDLHAGSGIGRIMSLGSATTITPQARLDYFAVSNQSYTESGAGVLNLHVDSQTQEQLIPALQVKLNHSLTPKLSLALSGGVGYDVLNDRNSVSSSFAGGGGVFVTRGLESSPWVVRSGAGLTWKPRDTVDLTARYDREDRGSDYDNQTLSLKLRIPF